MTIVRIRLEIDFATVIWVTVAVGKTGIARTYATYAQCALRGRVGSHALCAATAAIVRVAVRVGFTTVGDVAVAITKRALTIGNAALADCPRVRLAGGCTVGLVWALVGANAAVIYALGQIDFTTVGHKSIAIGEALGTRNTARSCVTSRTAIRAIACSAARPAIGC